MVSPLGKGQREAGKTHMGEVVVEETSNHSNI
jgi:hypothetical protein